MLVDKDTIVLGIFVEDGLVTVVMGEWEEVPGTSYAIAVEKNTSVRNRLLQEKRYFYSIQAILFMIWISSM